jgi:signal transduction histidine kinase/drug/metabolite transporter superfamily protein YnfA
VNADTIIEILDYATAAVFTVLGLVALWSWLRRRDSPSLWAALCFATLTIVVLADRVLSESGGQLGAVLERAVVITILFFPYLLYRFTAAFEPSSRALDVVVTGATVAITLWTILLPHFPDADEPTPTWFEVYIVAFAAHWGLVSAISAGRFWRAGRGQPTVSRRRVQILSFAAMAMTATIFLAVAATESGSNLEIATSALAVISGLAFLLGLAPPSAVRLLWRRPEQDRVRDAIQRLVSATSPEQVASDVLPPMTRLVGARAAFLLDEEGNVLGSHGAPAAALKTLRDDNRGVLRLPIPGGSLVVWTSPFAPFFGTEELELLGSLGALTGLALDRTRLFSQEREARLVLERADELKTGFIALAAHELRTPVTSVHGVVSTLDRLGDQLSPDDRRSLEQALRSQSERLRRLVDQLLDLSRLEGEAVEIQPVPIPVRTEVEQLVDASTPERANEIEIRIADGLKAEVDRTVFERVVTNLLTNAVRHGTPPILVSAAQSDSYFRLAVEDRGAGVPAEFVADLFERFSRSAEARARGLGSGLGLSIARSYARAHGGDLVYERARPHGARFELVIPSPDQ